MSKIKNKLKPVNTPVYNYWSALYKSFYSKLLYLDVGKRWKGIGLWYLLLSVALFCIPFVIKVGINLNTSFNEQIIEPLSLLPTVYVQNGEVNFDKPMPYLIKNNKKQVVLGIDTTGTIKDFDPHYPDMNILITKNALSFKIPTPQLFSSGTPDENSQMPYTQTFSKNSNFAFNGQKIIEQNTIYGLKYAALSIIYPVVVVMFYSLFIILFLVLAFLGQVFSRTFFSFPLSFKTSSRLFMVATTPMLFILMLMLTTDKVFPGLGFILMGIVTIYFSLGVSALKWESKRMVRK